MHFSRLFVSIEVYAAELNGIELALAKTTNDNKDQEGIGQNHTEQMAREVIIPSDSQAAIQGSAEPTATVKRVMTP